MENQNSIENQNQQNSNSNAQKVKLVLAAALFASSLNPKEVKASDVYQEPTPLIQPLRSYGPYRSVEEELNSKNPPFAPVCYNVVADENVQLELMEQEQMPLDTSILNIDNWEGIEMNVNNVEYKEKGYTVEVASGGAEVYSIPLLQSTFIHRRYNDYRPVKKFSVPVGMTYEILEERELIGKNGETVTVGLISNNFQKMEGLVIVTEAKDSYGVEETFVNETVTVTQGELESSLTSTNTFKIQNSVETYPVNGEYTKQIDLLYSLEDLSVIDEFIKDDEVVQSFIQLRNLFKEYDRNTYDLPKYLISTPWYEEMVKKNGIEVTEKAIQIPYNVRIATQPLQCVGFVEMMEELYPELNMVDISSMSTEEGAQSLVPRALFPYYNSDISGKTDLYNGGVGIGGNALDINEYQRGDIFVIYGGDFGHVGLILGKYEVEGRTVLLLADSNKLVDGTVRLYIVNEENIEEVLGKARYILRNAE